LFDRAAASYAESITRLAGLFHNLLGKPWRSLFGYASPAPDAAAVGDLTTPAEDLFVKQHRARSRKSAAGVITMTSTLMIAVVV